MPTLKSQLTFTTKFQMTISPMSKSAWPKDVLATIKRINEVRRVLGGLFTARDDAIAF